MKGIPGLVFTLALGAAALSSPRMALAGWGVETVNCYSEGGHRSHCRVPWDDARLVRQDSRSPCVRGHTWGMDRRGIWVDDGCRGIFEDANARHGRGGYRHRDRYHDDHHDYDHAPPWHGDHHDRRAYRGRIVSCDSNDNKRVFCRWPIGRGARLVEQTSRRDCDEGYSYGFTRDGIWASKGCRGKFDIGD